MSICKQVLQQEDSECDDSNRSAVSGQVSKADLVGTYLREIGRIPLLTHEQEIDYGRQVQQMISLLFVKETLTNKLERGPTLQEWATQVQVSESELTAILQRGQQAKEKMIKANLRLVVAIAKLYPNRGLELLELIQEGSLGLIRAVEKFSPTRGYKFSTCAYWWIRQAMTRAIGQQSRTVRLPMHVIEKLNKIKKAQRKLSQNLGRTPKVFEVAAELKLTPNQVRKYLEQAQNPVSLNLWVGEEQDTELGELLEDSGMTPEQLTMQSDLVASLVTLLAELTQRQREVLELSYGLRDGRAISFAEIGRKLNLSRERVRQIELKALNVLRARRSQIGQSWEVSDGQGFKDIPASVELSASFSTVQLEFFELKDGHLVCPECSVPALL